MSYTASFLQSVEVFLRETGMNATRLGKEALGDPSFVPDLRNGRAPSSRIMDRVASFMAEHRRRVAKGQAA